MVRDVALGQRGRNRELEHRDDEGPCHRAIVDGPIHLTNGVDHFRHVKGDVNSAARKERLKVAVKCANKRGVKNAKVKQATTQAKKAAEGEIITFQC
jgi:hypothetical protein